MVQKRTAHARESVRPGHQTKENVQRGEGGERIRECVFVGRRKTCSETNAGEGGSILETETHRGLRFSMTDQHGLHCHGKGVQGQPTVLAVSE